MLSSSPSSNMHLMVPSGKLYASIKQHLHDFFGTVWEVLFDLIIGEFEHLQSVWKRCLSGLCLREVVSHLLVRESLLDVLIVEVDYRVAIREAFSFNSVVENHFLLAILVDPLDLAIMTNNLLHDFRIRCRFTVVLFWEFQTVVLVVLRLLV